MSLEPLDEGFKFLHQRLLQFTAKLALLLKYNQVVFEDLQYLGATLNDVFVQFMIITVSYSFDEAISDFLGCLTGLPFLVHMLIGVATLCKLLK